MSIKDIIEFLKQLDILNRVTSTRKIYKWISIILIGIIIYIFVMKINSNIVAKIVNSNMYFSYLLIGCCTVVLIISVGLGTRDSFPIEILRFDPVSTSNVRQSKFKVLLKSNSLQDVILSKLIIEYRFYPQLVCSIDVNKVHFDYSRIETYTIPVIEDALNHSITFDLKSDYFLNSLSCRYQDLTLDLIWKAADYTELDNGSWDIAYKMSFESLDGKRIPLSTVLSLKSVTHYHACDIEDFFKNGFDACSGKYKYKKKRIRSLFKKLF